MTTATTEARNLAEQLHALYATDLTERLLREVSTQHVYVSADPLHLKCNGCGLKMVISLQCPRENGTLVIDEERK